MFLIIDQMYKVSSLTQTLLHKIQLKDNLISDMFRFLYKAIFKLQFKRGV
jgi:hypothetical protein